MYISHRHRALYVWLLLVLSGLQAQAQQPLLLDDFTQPPSQSYRGYAPPPVEIQEGYSLYYASAHIQLRRRQEFTSPPEPPAHVLQFQYTLPPAFSWGNWLTVRREFASPFDLSPYESIELTFKVAAPSHALLRITLSDLGPGSVRDEMWWFDCPPETLRNATADWQTIRIPLRSFSLSRGAGTRHNDHRWNPSQIVAYEVNVLSPPGEQVQGTILLKALRGLP